MLRDVSVNEVRKTKNVRGLQNEPLQTTIALDYIGPHTH